jgi:hypothetical protein
MLRALPLYGLLLLASLLAADALAQPKVFFAGMAYLGDSADIENNFPYTSQLLPITSSGEQSKIEESLYSKMRSVQPSKYQLELSSLADINKGQSLALALTIDRETVDIEPICGRHKTVVNLGLQATIFDFETMSVVGSYPMTIEYIDVTAREPSKTEILQMVSDLYMGNLEVNVFDQFTSLLERVEVKRKYANRIQVTSVDVEPKAIEFLPDQYDNNLRAFETLVAQNLGKALVKEHGISILPYTKGNAIGNKMATRFANGEIFNFDIPETDYEIHLTVRGFKKVLFNKKSAGQSVVYGSFLKVKAVEPFSGEVYIDQNLKRGVTKVVPACQARTNDWPAFQESLLGLLAEFAKQVKVRDGDWIESHASDGSVEDEMEVFEDVLERCK